MGINICMSISFYNEWVEIMVNMPPGCCAGWVSWLGVERRVWVFGLSVGGCSRPVSIVRELPNPPHSSIQLSPDTWSLSGEPASPYRAHIGCSRASLCASLTASHGPGWRLEEGESADLIAKYSIQMPKGLASE